MKFPLWILMALIITSLVFAGVMTYKLYRAQVISSPPAEALTDVVDAIPSSPILPVTPKSLSLSQPSVKSVNEQPVHKYEKARAKNELEQNNMDNEPASVRIIQKIGSISVNAGEVTAVSVIR